MTPRHPNAKSYDVDGRFSESEATIAASRPEITAALSQRHWNVLKEWVVLTFEPNQPEIGTAQRMRWTLHYSKKNDWETVKTILLRRNWPRILDQLAAWKAVNQHL